MAGGLTLLPSAAAQTTAPVSLSPLRAPNPYTVDGGHALELDVRNTGAVVVQGTVRFYHTVIQGGNLLGSQQFTVAPGQSTTVSQPWNGRVPPNAQGQPVTDTRDVFARLEEVGQPLQVPEDDTRPKELTFHYHSLDIEAKNPTIPSAQPEHLVEQEFLIKNLGNVVEDVAVSLIDATAAWKFLLDDDLLQSVQPGGSRTVVLQGIAPTGAASGTEGKATVRASPTGFPAAVATAASHAFTVDVDAAYLLTGPASPVTADPGQTVQFAIQAANQGNAPISLGLQAIVPSGFPPIGFSPSTLNLDPGKGGTSTASAATTSDTPAGDYAITVRATPSDSGIPPEEVVADVTITQRYGVQLSFPSDEFDHKDVEPTQSGTFRVTLGNTGNGPDQYALEPVGLPNGWTYDRTVTSDDTIVGQGIDVEAEVEVGVPAGTAPGSYPFSVRASSLGDSTKKASLDVRVDVPQVPLPAATAASTVQPIVGGQTVNFTVTVENIGNHPDTFGLQPPALEEAIPEHDDWTATWESTSFDLAPGESSATKLTITSPPEEDVDISSKARFLLTAVAASNGRTHAVSVEAQTAAPDLTILAIDPPGKTYAGAQATLKVVVANVGTQDLPEAADVRVEVIREGQAEPEHVATQQVDALAWDPAADDHTATLSFVWTPKFGEDYSVVATADPENNITEKADETTPSFNNNARDAPVTARTFDATVTAPLSKKVLPGQRVFFDGSSSFILRNTGSHSESFRLNVSTDEGWSVTLATTQVTLAPHTTRQIAITLDVPLVPGVLDESFTLVADGDGPGTFEASALLKIVDEDPPEIRDVSVVPSDPEPGDSFNVTARVTDATQVAQVRAVIVAPNGVRTVLAMSQDTAVPSNWTLQYALAEPGRYQVSVMASDIVEPPNTASTQSNPTAVTVRTGTAPTITFLAVEPGQALRGTHSVSFTANDQAGIQRVWFEAYAVNETTFQDAMEGSPVLLDSHNATANRTLPVGNPHSAALTGVPDGYVVVVAYAENAYGAASAALIPVRVDNTPPKIVGVEPVAQSLDRLRIRATVEPPDDVAAVELVATLNDNTNQRFPFNASESATHYEVDVTLSKPMTGWRVVAWDQVGNSAVYEAKAPDAAQQQAAGGPAPAGSVLLVLAAVALTIASLRTRRPTP